MSGLTDWHVRPALGEPLATVGLRGSPEEFRVDEVLGFEPSGAGEHLLLRIEKRGLTTDHAIRTLARALGVRPRNIGHAGLKDRHAVTRQSLSVPWPVKRPMPELPALDGLRVLDVQRHHRKLRPGSHRANRFGIVCRLESEARLDSEVLARRLEALRTHGCPNAFGPQRFGRDGDNVVQFMQFPAGRRPPSILPSAARSLLFNQVLDRRIADGSWHAGLPGDWMALDGSGSGFAAPELDAALAERLRTLDIHPTGPMAGQGEAATTDAAAEVEAAVLAVHDPVVDRLRALGVSADRRPLRVRVSELAADVRPDAVELQFSLPPGSYATTVIAQCFAIDQAM